MKSSALFSVAGSPAAGAYFPQAVAHSGERMDDSIGTGAALIARDRLTSPALAPFAEKLGRWLDAQNAEAVLVRPDRHVFGTGTPETLAAAWQAATGLEPPSPLA